MRTLLLAYLLSAFADSPGGDPIPTKPDERYQYLIQRWEGDWQAFLAASDVARSEREIEALKKLPGMNPFNYVPGFMGLAREHPGGAAAEASLVWVASNVRIGREAEEAKEVLARNHIRSTKLAPVFAFQVSSEGSKTTEPLLRQALAESPHREIRGMACYWLARYQMAKAEACRQARRLDRPGTAPPKIITDGWGEDYLERLKRLDPDALEREAVSLFGRVVREFADVPHNDKRRKPGTLGMIASGFLHDLVDLSVGKPAPETEGVDLDGNRFRLGEYRGQIVVLDFGSHFYCGTCRQMYPHERAIVERLSKRSFALVTIDVDRDRDEVKAAWKAEGNSWRCVYEATPDGPISTAWNVNFFPTIVVIDREGVIRFKATGDPGEELDRVIDSLLQEGNSAPHEE